MWMGKMDISYTLDPRHEKPFMIVSMLQFRVSRKLWTLNDYSAMYFELFGYCGKAAGKKHTRRSSWILVVFILNPAAMDSRGTFTYVETKPWGIPNRSKLCKKPSNNDSISLHILVPHRATTLWFTITLHTYWLHVLLVGNDQRFPFSLLGFIRLFSHICACYKLMKYNQTVLNYW